MDWGRGEGRGRRRESPMGRLFRLKVSESLRLFGSRVQLVAGAADSDDQVVAAELAAQVRDVRVGGALVRHVGARPQVLEDLAPRVDVSRPVGEERQKTELRARQ